MKKLLKIWCKIFGHDWYHSMNNPHSPYRFCPDCCALKHIDELKGKNNE